MYGDLLVITLSIIISAIATTYRQVYLLFRSRQRLCNRHLRTFLQTAHLVVLI